MDWEGVFSKAISLAKTGYSKLEEYYYSQMGRAEETAEREMDRGYRYAKSLSDEALREHLIDIKEEGEDGKYNAFYIKGVVKAAKERKE